MGEYSHCTECGDARSDLDFHGVCGPCRVWFREQDKLFEEQCHHQGGTFIDSRGHELCTHCLKDFGPEEWPYPNETIEF